MRTGKNDIKNDTNVADVYVQRSEYEMISLDNIETSDQTYPKGPIIKLNQIESQLTHKIYEMQCPCLVCSRMRSRSSLHRYILHANRLSFCRSVCISFSWQYYSTILILHEPFLIQARSLACQTNLTGERACTWSINLPRSRLKFAHLLFFAFFTADRLCLIRRIRLSKPKVYIRFENRKQA